MRMHLCSFGHALAPVLALLGVLLYTHALLSAWSFCGSIGSLVLYTYTYVRLSMMWLYWESCFICIH